MTDMKHDMNKPKHDRDKTKSWQCQRIWIFF